MKIDPPAAPATPLPRLVKAAPAAPANAAATPAAGPDADAAPAATGQVRLLQSSALGGDFDAARVAAIREDIRAGRYEVRPERIADGVLASVRELLNPNKSE